MFMIATAFIPALYQSNEHIAQVRLCDDDECVVPPVSLLASSIVRGNVKFL